MFIMLLLSSLTMARTYRSVTMVWNFGKRLLSKIYQRSTNAQKHAVILTYLRTTLESYSDRTANIYLNWLSLTVF